MAIRVAHLVDVAFLTNKDVSDLMRGLEAFGDICVLHIGNDYTFICHRQLLRNHLAGYKEMANPPPYYVCIDEALQAPTMQNSCAPLYAFIRDQLQPFLSSEDRFFHFENTPACMISLTGWLLEYPVIYVQSGEGFLPEWKLPAGNSLSGISLIVFEVGIRFDQESRLHRMMSFSYPAYLFNEQQQNIIDSHLRRGINSRCEMAKWKYASLASNIYCDITVSQESFDRVAM
ncbi:hypothetical protein NQZ79_g6504 [Umbelopsis isabellina]|nr:hypothetical protein NQZ79_g6504 [Umbelopsis isabellina]